jgi:outer membrane protein W
VKTRKTEIRLAGSAIAMLTLAGVPHSSLAQQFEPTWQLKADLAFVDPSGESVLVDVDSDRVDIHFDSKAGVGLRAEYRFTESLGAEIGVLGTASFDVAVGNLGNLAGVTTRVSSFTPVTAGLNYHFTPGSRVDLSTGAFLAAVNYGDIEVSAGTGVSTSISADRDFAWGAVAGLEIPVGSGHWSLHADLRYIDTDMKGTSDGDPFEGEFDPLIFSIGFGYRF